MASSNRHWPSMFKSKPSNTNHHQWQSSGCHRNPYISGLGSEERTPEPKPRWNPRPEQIRILESIFNSGMVNPPRDEIRKIRAQLQEYGQVGDANVFYWFQNRKSRSKQKQRQLHSGAAGKNQPAVAPPTSAAVVPSSSSSSSDKTSSEKSISLGPTSTVIQDLLNSPTASVNQPFLQGSSEFLAEAPFLFGGGGGGGGSTSAGLAQGFCFPEAADHGGTVGSCQSLLLSELMLMSGHCSSKKDDDFEKMKADNMSLGFNVGSNVQNTDNTIASSISPVNAEILQGAGSVGEQGPTKSTVFINDVCFEVGVGPFSVREAFGYDAVLVHSSGQPVLTNEWGVTLQPLQQGAFYYLLRPFTAPHDKTIDLI